MEELINNTFLGISIFFLIGLGGFTVASIKEKERRAALVSGLATIVGSGIFIFVIYVAFEIKLAILFTVLFGLLILLILFYFPIGKIKIGNQVPANRIDERDIMFARARLKPGSKEYKAYYKLRPENENPDEKTRAKPGLMSLDAKLTNPILNASPVGSFDLTHALRDAVDGPVSENKKTLPIEEMTHYIKNLTKFYGALDMGITELKPYHVYSHIGRGPGKYGSPLPVEGTHAICADHWNVHWHWASNRGRSCIAWLERVCHDAKS